MIAFNTGMHDLKYLNGRKLDTESGKPQCPPEQYAANLKKNVEWLQQKYPQAKLVYITTTPVPDGAKGRIPGMADDYNQVARGVLKDFPDVVVMDLYAFTKPHQKDWWKKPGDIHYTQVGAAEQGRWLAEKIRQLLADKI